MRYLFIRCAKRSVDTQKTIYSIQYLKHSCYLREAEAIRGIRD